MSLILTPFSDALARLHEGLERFTREPDDAHIRDGLIQRFEFTFDLAAKTLRRVVASLSDDAATDDRMTFGEMIRTADDLGLTPVDWPAWKRWRDLRNITSHTYDEAKAKQAVTAIPAFASAMDELLSKITISLEKGR